MNARGWLEDGVDLALVGAVAAWIGIAGAFLASLTPRGKYAAAQNGHETLTALRSGGRGEHPGASGSGSFSYAREKGGNPPEGGVFDPLPAGLLERLAALESGGDDSAVNQAEDAHGRWQVRAGYLADGNAEAGTSYALDEMHDPAKAETIVRAYLSRYGRAFAARAGRAPTAEELARIHNGGPRGAESPRTLAYARAFAGLAQ